MDLMPLRLNSSSLICSICALAAIILQLVATECQTLHMVDSPITDFTYDVSFSFFVSKNRKLTVALLKF